MSSMYETIMELPLFKGIGGDQLSQMLEKTSIEFLKYEDGEELSAAGSNVTGLDFILGGRVRQTYRLQNYPIEIDEILGKGNVMGALNLFGMDTTYPSTSTAIGRVSIMRIKKSQYINVLQSDRIYLLNFMNYISAAVQKNPVMMTETKNPIIGRTLEILALSFVSRGAESVMICGEDSALAEYCGVSLKEFKEWKAMELSHKHIIVNQRGIFLKSPHLLR